jgi:predicted metal-dependent hydrolase
VKGNSGLLRFLYGGKIISCEREERRSTVPRLLIKVHPEGRVVAHARLDASDAEVLAALKRRGRWIHEQLEHFRAQLQERPERSFVSGESHLYLGRRHQLKVIVDAEAQPRVRLWRGQLEVTQRESDPVKGRELLAQWYKERARELFPQRLAALLPQLTWIKEEPKLKLLTMKAQWGNCSTKGTLTLNPQLIRAPRPCIDYVILHELCHLAEHNHSPRFYRLLTQLLPEWQELKERLDGVAQQ